MVHVTSSDKRFILCVWPRAAGYDETQCEQPWTVSLALKMLLVPPIFFLLVALALLHYYPITERSREKTKRLLQERR